MGSKGLGAFSDRDAKVAPLDIQIPLHFELARFCASTAQLPYNLSYKRDCRLCLSSGKTNAFVSFRNTNRKLVYTKRPLRIRGEKIKCQEEN